MFNDFFSFRIPIGAVGAFVLIIYYICKKMYSIFYNDFRNKLLLEQQNYTKLEIKYDKLNEEYTKLMGEYKYICGKNDSLNELAKSCIVKKEEV